MKKKVIAGLVFSALLVYLSVRGIDFQGVAEGFRTIHYGYVPPTLALLFLMQVLRSFRWGLILSPLAKIDQLSLFSVTSVGFLAIVAIPARLGELARPYLITKKSCLKMSSALGTIIVERVLDSLTVLVIAVFVLFFIPLPPWLVRASVLFLLATLALLAVMILMILKQEASLRILAMLSGKLPARYAEGLNRLIHHFLQGFRIMVNPALLASVTGLSILIWLIDVLVIYLLFLAFGFQLPVAAAFVLMIVLIILVVAVGGLVEIVPLYFQKSTTEPVAGLKPYTPAQLVGQSNGEQPAPTRLVNLCQDDFRDPLFPDKIKDGVPEAETGKHNRLTAQLGRQPKGGDIIRCEEISVVVRKLRRHKVSEAFVKTAIQRPL